MTTVVGLIPASAYMLIMQTAYVFGSALMPHLLAVDILFY